MRESMLEILIEPVAKAPLHIETNTPGRSGGHRGVTSGWLFRRAESGLTVGVVKE